MIERIWQKSNPKKTVAYIEETNSGIRTHVLKDNGEPAFIIEEKVTREGKVLTQIVDPATGLISGEHVE